MWCKSCRVTGYTHCAHPDECGNMVTLTAAADSWKSWLDDAPLPETFNSATGGLQDFITALSRALLTARAELAQARADTVDIVRNVWGRCEALEDESADKLVLLEELTDHEKGFWRGQKTVAKSIRRSTEMPTAAQKEEKHE